MNTRLVASTEHDQPRVNVMNLRLSICIPTYNFGSYIEETLDSIPRIYDDCIEIVVYDGGSTDQTKDRMLRYARGRTNVRYLRSEKRGGIDCDMDIAVRSCSAPYVWLFSSDDVMQTDSIGLVLKELSSNSDVYLCGLIICDKQMREIDEHRFTFVDDLSEFNLGDTSQRLAYFKNAITSTALFSFMSSIIVRRSVWVSARFQTEFNGSCWAHVALFFSKCDSDLKLKILKTPLLLKRGGNDSFMENGLVNRISISIDGFTRIAESFFGAESSEAREVKRVLRNEWPLRYLFHLYTGEGVGIERTELRRLRQLMQKIYANSGGNLPHLFYFNLKVIPGIFFKLARRFYGTIC